MSADNPEITKAKKSLRAQVIKRRDKLPEAKSLENAAIVATQAKALSARFGHKACISVYACMESEMDPTPLCDQLTDLDCTLCLPVMGQLGQPLLTR